MNLKYYCDDLLAVSQYICITAEVVQKFTVKSKSHNLYS